jgi:peptide-methionine (S)-S-oxide reductase
MAQHAGIDALFREAVAAIDAGDVASLRRLLEEHRDLAGARLEAAGPWLRDRIGTALDAFFARPYLLWFVAEDPVLNDRLPTNIVDVIAAIVAAVRRDAPGSLQEQLDSTLPLVCWSGVAARCGVQLAMIDALIDAGAAPAENAHNALVNGHIAAAERLVARGGDLTLATALCIGRLDDVPRLAVAASPLERQFAFVLAALNGRADAVAWMARHGIPINEPSQDLYAHGTPLHHAVCSGSLDTVKVLVEAGADLTRLDTAWSGTPLDWAKHSVEGSTSERRDRYAAIAAYLSDRQER